ncbi:hypothetical protein DL95DRAFT_410076 [Leptodontidium sp. 2 PMI_412]|nr:hypothetical protein DL95DRAFT_410076 [Leptodontidium sp. 2 PMI_412]
MPLLRLPAEVLSHIFSYDCLTPHDLYQLILTCRRTYDIGILSLYRRVCISARPNHVIPGKSIITNMKGFSDCVDQQPALASLVHAAELYLETDCPGRTNRLLGLLSRFTSIKTLTLAGAYGGFPKSYLVRNIAAFKTLLNLRHITLTADHGSVDPQDLAGLISSVPNLSTLSLRRFDGFWGSVCTDNPLSKLVRIEFSEAVEIPRGRNIKSFLAGHPLLRTLIWTINMNAKLSQEWSSDSVNTALSPLKPHLVNLCLTIVNGAPAGPHRSTQSQSPDRRIALDYSGFAMLKNLEIHDRLTFDKTSNPGTYQANHPLVHNYKSRNEDLHARLPKSLQTLTINFHSGSEVLEGVIGHERLAGYSWLLALARYKAANFGRLSRVDIVQILDCNSQGAGADSNTSGIAAEEWEYPLDAVKLFRGAGIVLKVCSDHNSRLSALR